VLALRSREPRRGSQRSPRKRRVLPTLSLSTGIGGYTYGFANSNFPVQQAAAQLQASKLGCIRTEEVRAALNLSNQLAECTAMAFTDAQASAIRQETTRNSHSTSLKSPRSFSAVLSLPLFDGFSREQRLQEAMASRSDARYDVKSKELALTADVTAAYLTLVTAEKTVTLQGAECPEGESRSSSSSGPLTESVRRRFVDLTEARANVRARRE